LVEIKHVKVAKFTSENFVEKLYFRVTLIYALRNFPQTGTVTPKIFAYKFENFANFVNISSSVVRSYFRKRNKCLEESLP